MSGSPDVAVVGAGIVGLATACFLAEGGANVTVYEREAIAAGASGRNSGVIQHPFDPVLVPLYEETVRLYRRLEAATGARIAAFDDPAGLLLVTHHPPIVQALAAELGAAFPSLHATALDPDELKRLEPAMAEGVAACRFDMGYPVVPAAPTYAFANWAERLGVTIRLGRDARPALDGDRCVGVEVGNRVDPAAAVIVAAGPWTPQVVDPSGRWRPIEPRWGVVVETLLAHPPSLPMEEAEMDEALGTGEAAANAIHRGDPSHASHASHASTAEAGELDSTPTDPDPEFSLITASGASAVGSTFLDREPDAAAWTERLLRRAITFVPGVLDAPIREVRACARPASIDGHPLAGAAPGIRDLYIAAGHGPWGISTGPATAHQVANLVLGRDAAIDPAFDPARIGIIRA